MPRSALGEVLDALLLEGMAQRQHERNPVPVDGLQPGEKLNHVHTASARFDLAHIALLHAQALRNVRLRHPDCDTGLAKHGKESGITALVHSRWLYVKLKRTRQNGPNAY